ncbi:MAG TPA: glycosyltransferase, partial [Patescibacteria group bacterium]|nr:glycosyltransferase [Patescibacteria group bacterium]
MKQISVVIPTHNRNASLKQTLQALLDQSYPFKHIEIIVCDDGSTDKTSHLMATLVKKYPHQVRYLRQTQKGPAAARNLGILKAQGEIIAFTDDDCLPDKDWVLHIVSSFQRHPNIIGVEGKTVPDTNTTDLMTYTVINETGGNYFTCNIAYTRKVLQNLKGFDETFRYSHCEDIDLARRVLENGQIVFIPQALVIHPARRANLLSGIKRLKYLADEFRLYKKHEPYFSQFFPTSSFFLVCLLITFGNHIWYRF